MPFRPVSPQLLRADTAPQPGELARIWREHGARVVVGHPTFHNPATIGPLLEQGIRGAPQSFGGRPVAFVVTDGSIGAGGGDPATLDAAEAGARAGLEALDPAARQQVCVTLTPYEGYGGVAVPGKGSALQLIFEELGGVPGAELLMLADGDLRNEMGRWQRVYAEVERAHRAARGDAPFFITARYARHFVDASLTRFVVGPLTTLLGCHVPGGISGDIVLSAGAVAHERQAEWTEARRKYGTDIATTFDNIAHPDTVIYEVYLGAKLHDITDEAKLSVMPGEVIGAALERILHWETHGGLVSRTLASPEPLRRPQVWGPERTGIAFIDPGRTDVFDVDAKMAALHGRWPDYADAVRAVLGEDLADELSRRVERLGALRAAGDGQLDFLGVDRELWIEVIQRAVAMVLVRRDAETLARAKASLSYLYTAAFLQFVRGCLARLGCTTIAQTRAVQGALGVPGSEAEAFYNGFVDGEADALAAAFFAARGGLAEKIAVYSEANIRES